MQNQWMRKTLNQILGTKPFEPSPVPGWTCYLRGNWRREEGNERIDGRRGSEDDDSPDLVC
jgi:hypothetical protein